MRPLTGKELAKILEQHGRQLARVRGSHHFYTKPGRTERLSIPIHGSSTLKPGLQKHLVKTAGLPDDAVREESAVYHN
jgi:predicted RNA binding protein YcfA (HicA-like mRNA interferase family)